MITWSELMAFVSMIAAIVATVVVCLKRLFISSLSRTRRLSTIHFRN